MPKFPFFLYPLLIALASLIILLAALGFEHLGGFVPCVLCLAQRTPHWLAVVIGCFGALAVWPRAYIIGALSMLAAAAVYLYGAGLAIYHVGVEQKWWQGPATCTRTDLEISMDPDVLFATDMVRCDISEWFFLGLTMASYNALLSLTLACASLMIARRLYLQYRT